MLSAIPSNLHTVQARIQKAALKADRDPAEITLIAVSKTQPAAAVRAAHAAGQQHFAENYLQDALKKVSELADTALCWHFIGRLQSNKTRSIAAHFDWVHTVDRLRVARRLSAARLQSHPQGPALNICLQVNIDADDAKAGIAAAAITDLAGPVSELSGIRCRGLMTMLQATGDAQASYARMQAIYGPLAAQFGWDTLSMGMSGDFPQAIANGSTMVRVGTAIFGPRLARPAPDKTTDTAPGGHSPSDQEPKKV